MCVCRSAGFDSVNWVDAAREWKAIISRAFHSRAASRELHLLLSACFSIFMKQPQKTGRSAGSSDSSCQVRAFRALFVFLLLSWLWLSVKWSNIYYCNPTSWCSQKCRSEQSSNNLLKSHCIYWNHTFLHIEIDPNHACYTKITLFRLNHNKMRFVML